MCEACARPLAASARHREGEAMIGIGSRYTWGISTTHTLDGVRVEPGLRVWDYDMRAGVVEERAPRDIYPDDYDYWWDVRHEDGSTSMMNASRMWVWHPHRGVKA